MGGKFSASQGQSNSAINESNSCKRLFSSPISGRHRTSCCNARSRISRYRTLPAGQVLGDATIGARPGPSFQCTVGERVAHMAIGSKSHFSRNRP